jgi:hypothetical protein
MINLKLYPFLQLSDINNNEGTFTKKALLEKSFLTTSSDTLFSSINNHTLLSYNKTIKRKHLGFLIEIIFHGFNFSAKRLQLNKGKFYLDTHRSEIFIYDEPTTSPVKSIIHKRRLIFFSYDSDLLNRIEKAIKLFKIPDSYTGKGIFERNDSYTIKQRKKRK